MLIVAVFMQTCVVRGCSLERPERRSDRVEVFAGCRLVVRSNIAGPQASDSSFRTGVPVGEFRGFLWDFGSGLTIDVRAT
jgi:hypothetical protein